MHRENVHLDSEYNQSTNHVRDILAIALQFTVQMISSVLVPYLQAVVGRPVIYFLNSGLRKREVREGEEGGRELTMLYNVLPPLHCDQ